MNKIKNVIWYEKYRQKDISNFSINKQTKRKIKEFLKSKEIPHLLFTGPPGSGKTTLSKILINRCASSSLELNGSSNDRGVSVVKTKVKEFAASLRRNKRKKNIVLFDEADGLTRDSQKALKNTIEQYQNNCRFIFTANQLELIDNAIYSRCVHFKFDSIPVEEVIKYCSFILKEENIKYKEKDLNKIVKLFYPDIRSVLNNLQICSSKNKLTIEQIIIDTPIKIKQLEKLLFNGEIGKIRDIWKNTTDFSWLWKVLIDKVIPKIKDSKKVAESAVSVAEYMYRETTVVDKEINATACLIDICLILDNNIKL